MLSYYREDQMVEVNNVLINIKKRLVQQAFFPILPLYKHLGTYFKLKHSHKMTMCEA